MNTEVKILFLAQYMPVAHKKQRLQGQDFLAIAYHIMDELRSQNKSQDFLTEAAQTMIDAFNDMLNPKISATEKEDMMSSLVNGGMLTRMVAHSTYEQLKNEGYL